MARPRLITGEEWRRSLLSLVLLIVLLAAVNGPVAMQFAPSRSTPRSVGLNWHGAAAAARGWPTHTPHSTAWPAPETLWTDRQFGRTHYDARVPSSVAGQNGFSMSLWRWGWPLPVFEQVQMWWDWNNAALKGPEPDPPVRVAWSGTLLNPLIIGIPIWVLTFGAWLMWSGTRRFQRRRQRQCMFCGYPFGAAAVCTECGRAALASV